ncbi:MAG: hypothetical protein RL291_102, partial [Pseudomonadota bacterium]
ASEFSIRKQLFACFAVVFGLIFGVGGWAATASIAGAVIASGTFVVERNVKKIQHIYGGIVAEINVKNGDRVEAGTVLLRLDPTQLRAELGVIQSQMIEHKARIARLQAERDGSTTIIWPAGFKGSNPAADLAIAGEQRLFTESRKVKFSQKDQLRHKLKQINEEITGLASQRTAKAGELEIVKREVTDLRPLHAGKLVLASKMNALERDLKRIEGEHGSIIAQMSRAQAQLSEIEVQILSIDEGVAANAQRELTQATAKLAELAERETATLDKLGRIEVRAPQAGTIHELAIHTIGGVVTPAEQLMLLVPEDEKLAVQARIQPNDIDNIQLGRPARLRLTAFNQQTTPEIEGTVVHRAADVTTDQKSGAPFYMVRVEIQSEARAKLGNVRLVPGMPVEAFFVTGDRTVLSYLLKPIRDQIERMFRE